MMTCPLPRKSRILNVVILLACAVPATAADDFSELIQKLPSSANVLVMLNAEQIFASELATAEGWKQKFDAGYSTSPLLLPPDAQQFVLAADLDLPTMKPRYEVAVLRLKNDPSMNMLASAVHGTRDSVVDLDAVATPKGGMIVKFAPKLFGMIQPGSRQNAARWVRAAAVSKANILPPYLSAAADVPDRVGTEIIMAIDLADSLNRERVHQAMANSEVLKNNKIDANVAANALYGLQGATLGVRVTRRTYGVLKIDFSTDTAPIAAVAKPLLLEVLSEAGASISEFASWNVKVSPRQIAIDGELTASGLRRLFSFLEIDATPIATDQAAVAATSPSYAEGQANPQVSLKYFQSIQQCLDDLRNERDASTYASIALWFDKYARKIERLPILGVDKDLVNYGQFVVLHLRDAVDAIRGVGIRSGAQNASVTGYAAYNMYDSAMNYTASAIQDAESVRRANRNAERAQGTTDARSLMREIEDATSQVKRQMTERYQIEFPSRPVKQQ